jgi:membrane-associated phospholipid phosphatase
MRFDGPRVIPSLKTALAAVRANLARRFLVACVLVLGTVSGVSLARGGELPSPLIAPEPVDSAANDFARSEIPLPSPVIAPEPMELAAGTRSIYEQALLGEEAPTLVLSVSAESSAAAAPESCGVIAPTSEVDAVTEFESSAACCDLPPIRYIDDVCSFLPRLGRDAVAVANWNNLAILGVALGGSLAVRSTLDNSVNNWTAEHPDRWGEGSKVIGNFGVAQYQIPVILGAYVYTVYAQDYYQHDMMMSLISAYTLFGISTVTIKGIADTNRPSDTWNGGKLGFPSWHDGSMFCMAAVLDDYEGHWIGYPLYIFAGLIGFSRIDTRDHNLSDVIFGGVLGYVIGKSVAGKALYGDARVRILPWVDPIDGGVGAMIDACF